jgi:type IV secretory pathway VirB4 component
MIQVEAVRVPTTDYPARRTAIFPDPVTRAIDAERRAFREGEGAFREPARADPDLAAAGAARRAARYVYSDSESRSRPMPTRCSTASDLDPRGRAVSRQRAVDPAHGDAEVERGGRRVARYDELFQFIRFCITGENHPVRLPEIPMYLDWLVTAEFQHGLTPMVENRYLAVVAIDGFPAESWPGILNAST